MPTLEEQQDIERAREKARDYETKIQEKYWCEIECEDAMLNSFSEEQLSIFKTLLEDEFEIQVQMELGSHDMRLRWEQNANYRQNLAEMLTVIDTALEARK